MVPGTIYLLMEIFLFLLLPVKVNFQTCLYPSSGLRHIGIVKIFDIEEVCHFCIDRKERILPIQPCISLPERLIGYHITKLRIIPFLICAISILVTESPGSAQTPFDLMIDSNIQLMTQLIKHIFRKQDPALFISS